MAGPADSFNAVAKANPKPPAGVVSRFDDSVPIDAPPRVNAAQKDGDTALVHLDHSPGASGQVALFLPKGFDPSKPAIMMPYFHGHGGGVTDAIERQRMTEIAAKSGKNIAFVIPQMGKKSDIKPEYRDPAYASKFLDESADALAKLYTQQHPDADPAKTAQQFHDMPVVPLSYSGGYQATLPNLQLPQVKGVVLLDSMYSDASYFTKFTQRKDKPFVSVMYGGTTADHTSDFARHAAAGSKVVKPSPSDHGRLVQRALGDVLQTISIGDGGKVTVAGLDAKTPNVTVAQTAPPGVRS